MYKDTSGRQIKTLHIEPTDVCQAKCPQCLRETDVEFNPKNKNHLKPEQILQVLTTDDLKGLDKLLLCGNYGDPAAGKHTLDIIKFVRKINPQITVGLHSNGGLQDTRWWADLAQLLNKTYDYVVFSIDGLGDQNHVYRVGVDWDTLVSNVRSFVSAGGVAHWDMLIFKHNQHQVNDCENLARELGFKIFRAKVSKRPMLSGLSLPIGWENPNVVKFNTIQCHALSEQSLYIDAQGRASPCCWLGSTQTRFISDFDQIRQSWQTNRPDSVCQSVCGRDDNGSSFTRQWQKQVEL